MRRAALVFFALACNACTFGFGSAYTGEWVARREVESRVCVQDDKGGCAETREVVNNAAPRAFHGFVMTLPVGVSVGNEGRVTPAISFMGEYMRGYGPFALGLRGGSHYADEKEMVPLMLMGHWGNSRVGLHLGGGYSVYTVDVSRDSSNGTSNDTFGGLLGLDIVLAETLGNRLVLGFEETYWRGNISRAEFHSIGTQAALGLYF